MGVPENRERDLAAPLKGVALAAGRAAGFQRHCRGLNTRFGQGVPCSSMGKVYSLTDKRHAYQPPPCVIHFTRSELNQLLSLYSRRVAGGEWRDYAIDQRAGQAAFSVFRHTHDRPLYTITKRRARSGQSVEYLV